jgi:hypothetical protein
MSDTSAPVITYCNPGESIPELMQASERDPLQAPYFPHFLVDCPSCGKQPHKDRREGLFFYKLCTQCHQRVYVWKPGYKGWERVG